MEGNQAFAAFGFGALSASSLLIGAVIGITVLPPRRLVAVIMAFGSGALISALAFELIEKAHNELVHEGYGTVASFLPLAIGSLIGGLAFVLVNRVLNSQGGFLRKPATTNRFLSDQKRENIASLLERLSKVEILRALPPEDIQAIVPTVDARTYPAGTTIFEEGEVGDALYLIEEGEVDVLTGVQHDEEAEHGHADEATEPAAGETTAAEAEHDEIAGDDGHAGGTRLARLGPGAAFGEMALLTGETRSADIVAVIDVDAWRIDRQDFDRLIAASPGLATAVSQLLARRVASTSQQQVEADAEARRWQAEAMRSVDPETLVPTTVEVRAAVQEHGGGGAPLAIFLGVLLDSIPESPVIGASMLGEGATVSVTLIVALFLANLPEAMSSAVGMKRNGSSTRTILSMWGFLVIFTGVGSMAGFLFLDGASPILLAGLEATAAGAILAMLAETMMPEAYEQSGGSAIGIATLVGFLAAFYVKTLSGHG